MTTHSRKDDNMIDIVNDKLDKVLEILNGNGKIGMVAQVQIDKERIDRLEKRPSNIKNWILAGAIILNTVIAGTALYRGIL